MSKALLFILAAFLASPAVAQAHPIDIELQNCLAKDSASSTLGMVKCLNQTYDSWDKELNKQYKLLMTDLTSEQKTSLRKSQLVWIQYRDSYFATMSDFYSTQDGTVWKIVHGEQRINVIKEKALSLESLRKSTCLAGPEDCAQ